jgi:putative glycosyl hydrolase-like family 6 (GHL6) protein
MIETRRTFIKSSVAAAVAVPVAAQPRTPWYLRTYRWGQTNITEQDPVRYDIAWWREHWKRTEVQGVIINAGGIVAYYPSKYPLHHRAQFLGDRDLFGELTKAAHDDGLVVFARMDSNRAAEDFYRAHPDWFSIGGDGQPYRAADKYIACINSPYYDEYLTDIIREIVERYRPEGVTDNSWAGLGRESICYCANCQQRFEAKMGKALPRRADWDDAAYRQWIMWSYARRTEIWDLNNRTTLAAGGPECIWSGMNSGSVSTQARSFRDLKEICSRAKIVMLDHQRRDDATGFQQNGETGKLIHGLLGWDKLAPESMAMYQNARSSFRIASKPAAEARMWMIAGFAGGIQPWWHHIAAYHEDRRMYRTAEPIMRWHKVNERYLINRRPVATAGLIWSQRNTDFYGRNQADDLVDAPYHGFLQALVRARIPYVPVHADFIDRDAPELAVLILPNLGALSDAQCNAVRRFVDRGGSLIATGESTLYDEWGDARPDFLLADLFGAHSAGQKRALRASASRHTYLRLNPELRARVNGPKSGDEPAPAGQRHPVLAGFDETDILPYGGTLEAIKTDSDVIMPLTFVPEFPVYPPETSWMREPKTSIPGLVLSTRSKGSRIAYMPADIDRRYARDYLPDHGNLLANIVRWAAGGNAALTVEGTGLIDCHLYQQPSRMILHVVNLTSAGTWRSPIDELIPVGPFRITLKLTGGVTGKSARFLVSSGSPAIGVKNGLATFEIKSILDHEVVVIS